MTTEAIIEKIRQLAPAEYNSIIIDNAVPIKKHLYCFIHANVQRVEYRTKRISAAIDGELRNALDQLIASHDRYPLLDPRIIQLMNEAPEYSTGSFFSSAKTKVSEMINGGRNVDHHHISLIMDNVGVTVPETVQGPVNRVEEPYAWQPRPSVPETHLSNHQPSFAIKDECSVSPCPSCIGTAYVERTNSNGVSERVLCPQCQGRGLVGTLSYFTPSVIDKQTSIIRCLSGEIKGLKFIIDSDGATIAGTSYKIHNGEPTRMLTHINGIDKEEIDSDLLPYIDMVRDKVGEDNAIEDYFYHFLPCYTFAYRNILTSLLHTGILIDPEGQPALILNPEGNATKLADSVKDSVKSITSFFGSITRSSAFKDKEDLKRTLRLLIAVAVADGTVDENEKKTLTLTIRGIDQLSTSEQEELVSCLGATDASFITDDDFHFHRPENAKQAIARMQEMAQADNNVHETERLIIEKLKLSI